MESYHTHRKAPLQDLRFLDYALCPEYTYLGQGNPGHVRRTEVEKVRERDRRC